MFAQVSFKKGPKRIFLVEYAANAFFAMKQGRKNPCQQ